MHANSVGENTYRPHSVTEIRDSTAGSLFICQGNEAWPTVGGFPRLKDPVPGGAHQAEHVTLLKECPPQGVRQEAQGQEHPFSGRTLSPPPAPAPVLGRPPRARLPPLSASRPPLLGFPKRQSLREVRSRVSASVRFEFAPTSRPESTCCLEWRSSRTQPVRQRPKNTFTRNCCLPRGHTAQHGEHLGTGAER